MRTEKGQDAKDSDWKPLCKGQRREVDWTQEALVSQYLKEEGEGWRAGTCMCHSP